ncbi:MAG: hypothetical protein A2X49_10690 [Lentisphaerae bacterium GWF2_52_8]|nr:MAG: hypothetical protein A2X49_10690 [Lentisphaerae bacterium GWF2_52_8]
MKGKRKELNEDQRKIEELEIICRHLENDLFLTRTENRENALKYLELLTELNMKNAELEFLRQVLSNKVSAEKQENAGGTEC